MWYMGGGLCVLSNVARQDAMACKNLIQSCNNNIKIKFYSWWEIELIDKRLLTKKSSKEINRSFIVGLTISSSNIQREIYKVFTKKSAILE